MRSRLFFFLVFWAVLTAAAGGVLAQTKDSDDVIRVDTQLVDVPVAVSNAAGNPIRDLTRANFVVYEDGIRQEVATFASSSAPFEVALLLDTSGSTRNDLQLIQRAAQGFISSLRPGDRVAIVAFSMERSETATAPIVDLLSPLTADRAKLTDALARMRMSAGTPYYDGLEKIAETVFKDAPGEQFRGRRAIVALTDGVDSTSIASFDEIRDEIAARSLITFFVQVDTREFFEENLLGDCETAMRFSAAQIRRYYKTIRSTPSMEKAGAFCQLGDFERLAISKKLYQMADDEMNDLANRSGGEVFPVADLGEARSAFKKVADAIGTKYTLGYYSSNDKRDGSVRKIKVELKGMPKGAQVRFRDSYTAPSN